MTLALFSVLSNESLQFVQVLKLESRVLFRFSYYSGIYRCSEKGTCWYLMEDDLSIREVGKSHTVCYYKQITRNSYHTFKLTLGARSGCHYLNRRRPRPLSGTLGHRAFSASGKDPVRVSPLWSPAASISSW